MGGALRYQRCAMVAFYWTHLKGTKAAEFQFAVDPSETKEAFILEPFGPL